MNQTFLRPRELERYSFLWSLARLVIAAVALFLGGIPPLTLIAVPSLAALVSFMLKIAWIISGVASAYLAYRWFSADQKLFGHRTVTDIAAFYVLILSGFNLGITGVFGVNIGMTISSNYFIFLLVAILYVVTAIYLRNRWEAAGRTLFS